MSKNALFPLLFLTILLACAEEKSSTTSSSNEEASVPKVTPSKPPATPVKVEEKSTFSIEYLTGKFDPAEHPDFRVIEDKYATRSGMYLRKDAYEAFAKMSDAARADGVSLKILSATRNFAAQKGIWEAKWTGARKVEEGENLAETTPDPTERALRILRWSSMPGTSRHHWGTDIDINKLTNEYFATGKGLKEYNWLQANAASYGFCQPYSPKDAQRPDGYNEEKWHWSYLPIARQLTDQAQRVLTNENITGFEGAETAKFINVVQKYVLGINEACL